MLSIIFSSEAADDGMGQSDANSTPPRTDEENIGFALLFLPIEAEQHLSRYPADITTILPWPRISAELQTARVVD